MVKRLVLLLVLMVLAVPLVAQNSQTTTVIQTDSQKTILTTMTAAGSQTFPIDTSIVNHALVYKAHPGITGLTVTFAVSTDGGSSFPTTCGSASTTTGAASITCTGAYNAGRVTLGGLTGSGPFDATYSGTTALDLSMSGLGTANYFAYFATPSAISGTSVFQLGTTSGSVLLTSANPAQYFDETDQTALLRSWNIEVSGGALNFNKVASDGTETNAIAIVGTGTTLTSVAIKPDLIVGGSTSLAVTNEVQTTDGGWSIVNTTNPGSTAVENYIASWGYTAAGNLVKQMSWSVVFRDTAQAGGYSSTRFNAAYQSSGVQTDDIYMLATGNRGVTIFPSSVGDDPAARNLLVRSGLQVASTGSGTAGVAETLGNIRMLDNDRHLYGANSSSAQRKLIGLNSGNLVHIAGDGQDSVFGSTVIAIACTGASCPALTRSGTGILVTLADNSNVTTGLTVGTLAATSATLAGVTSYVSIATSGTVGALNVLGNIYWSGYATTTAALSGAVCITAQNLVEINTNAGGCLVSALRYKENITALDQDDALKAVLAMRPVNYDLKDRSALSQFGFIADWAAELRPEFATRDRDGVIQGFKYEQYTAYLTAAFQREHRRVTELEQRIAQLEKRQ